MINPITCVGFASAGLCSMAWLTFVVLFFVCAFARKWLPDFGIPYNGLFGFGGLVVWFFVITLTGNVKLSFLIGLVSALALGVVGGIMFGGEEE